MSAVQHIHTDMLPGLDGYDDIINREHVIVNVQYC
jgi:hypothetical protein